MRIFKIEWPDNYGPNWLCKQNLEACVFSSTHISNVRMKITDVTEKPVEPKTDPIDIERRRAETQQEDGYEISDIFSRISYKRLSRKRP